MSNSYISFVYDPARQGLDLNLLKVVSGTPTVVSNKIQVNAAVLLGYADMKRGSFTYNVTVPTAPSAGNARRFGLFQISTGAGAFFDVTGTVFSCQVADGTGNTFTSGPMTWDPAWTNTNTRFCVKWESGICTFFGNGRQITAITSASANPNVSLSLYISNTTADNLLVGAIQADGIQSYI
jgi:hypothetical protein